jgi:RNA 2',3'-cyclic 3'-phosphodiesterase
MSAPGGAVPPDRAVKTHRLFFALWPGEPMRSALAGRVGSLVPPGLGRPQRPDQVHLTLEFLGAVPAARLQAARDAAAAVRSEPFELVLDAVEYWRRPRVLCLVAREIPPALAQLVHSLRVELASRGFEPERRPYRAHLTLARKVGQTPGLTAVEPLRWPATEFALVESVTERAGSNYQPLQAWPLQG